MESIVLCGADVLQKSTQNHPFNVQNVTISLLNCVNVSLIALSFSETTNYEKRIDVLFQSVSAGVCSIIYEIIVWKTSDTIKSSKLKKDKTKAQQK